MNSSNDIAIELKNVFEKYEIELTLDGQTTRESFEALHDISLTVKKGEGVAIMGPNGAGKSTLLRLIAGLLAPEKGEVKVNGRVGSLLDLGAGFHPELTGRDNLLLNASLYHFSREELDRKYEDILQFADIGKFINAPVRCYSQGMYVRLAFSLAIHVDPDIILIDDCLAVGDDNFRLKSVDKVLEMRERHTTIVLVTHDLDLAKKICSKGIYLRDSRIVLEGTLDEVAASYLKPVKVDKQLYQYLGAKISEEEKLRDLEEEERLKEAEELRNREEERQLRAEKERRRLEEEKQLIISKTGEEQRRLEEEWLLKVEKERRRLEEEKRLKVVEERSKLEEEWQLKIEKERQRLEEEKQLILIKAGEQHRKLDEERELRAEQERERMEAEKQLILEKTGKERRKLEEEWQLKIEKERQRLEEEKQLALIKAGEQHRKLDEERELRAEQERQKREEEKQLILERTGKERRKLEEEWQLKMEQERQKREGEKQLILEKAGEEHKKAAAEVQAKAEKARLKLEEEKQLILERAGEEHRKLVEELQAKAERERSKLEEEKQLILEKAGEEHKKAAMEMQLKMKEERQMLEKEKELSLIKAGEEHRKLSEEWQVKMEEMRQSLGKEKRAITIKAEEARCKMEEEKRLRLDLEKRLGITMKAVEKRKGLEKEKSVLSCGPSLQFAISPAKVQIIYQDREFTALYGMRTHFMIQGKDCYSDSASWRIRKISDQEMLCCLRWKEPGIFFQAWHFKAQNDGSMDLEITMRAPETLLIENEIVEYCTQVPCSILGEDRFHNKSTIFSCGQEGDLHIETLQTDQVCGIAREGKDFRPYFLTISEHASPNRTKRRRTYFKGRFFSGTKTALSKVPALVSQKVGLGRGKVEFYDGSCQLIWSGKRLTTGLGIYTSLYSNGIWYDSAQASWKIKASSGERLIVEGFWPWIPIAQTWEIIFKDEKTILLNAKMKLFRETPISMQETVMMVSGEYDKWSAGKKVHEFPEGFTSDDFFRFCLWANKADGVSGLAAHSSHLPTVLFKPVEMPEHRVIVENSQHIYGTQSRLFHCLRVNKKEEIYFASGEYEFFKGSIHIKEEKA